MNQAAVLCGKADALYEERWGCGYQASRYAGHPYDQLDYINGYLSCNPGHPLALADKRRLTADVQPTPDKKLVYEEDGNVLFYAEEKPRRNVMLPPF